MTIEEMRQKKVETEQKIGEAMTDFNKATGLKIHDLRFRSIDNTPFGVGLGPTFIYDAEITVIL